ncbi:hypothetical protein Ancab_024958 [Ancistrocladus abbreviatus]
MQLRYPTTAPTLALALLSALLLLTSTANGHNITRILAKHPRFSTFNHYLTATNLAKEINGLSAITVCAVDNAAMKGLLAKNPSISTIKKVLALHVLLDYFNAKRLHHIIHRSTLVPYLNKGQAFDPRFSGFVQIVDIRGGKVGFRAQENSRKFDAFFVRSVKEIPYKISVIQLNKILYSPPAEPHKEMNLTSIMSGHGCKLFADELSGTNAGKIYIDNIGGGLTIFCPTDRAFEHVLPEYENLTTKEKESLLLYHGLPVYASFSMLRDANGLYNTLASDPPSTYDVVVENNGKQVTLKTGVAKATIIRTLFDKIPTAIFAVDRVLLPKELFKPAAPISTLAADKAKEDGGGLM